jgi:hypothetical protein
VSELTFFSTFPILPPWLDHAAQSQSGKVLTMLKHQMAQAPSNKVTTHVSDLSEATLALIKTSYPSLLRTVPMNSLRKAAQFSRWKPPHQAK